MRERKAHLITPVEGNAQPKWLVALAADATVSSAALEPKRQDEHLVRWSSCGWADDKPKRRYHSYHDVSVKSWWRAVQWAARRPGMTWVVAHRAVRVLSLMDLWSWIERGAIELAGHDHHDAPREKGAKGRRTGGYVCIEDPPTIIQLRVPGRPGRIQIVDIRNWGIDDGPWDAPCAELAQWLAQVMERMVGVLARCQWGGLRPTAGSQAVYTWRRAYLSHEVECHADPFALKLERAAYVGGRCEAGRIGDVPGPVYQVDVRSMYPHVCVVSVLPARLHSVGKGDLHRVQKESQPVCATVAYVTVATEEAAYPYAAHKPTIYPTGRYRAVLAGPELDDALARGRIVAVHSWAQYEMQPCMSAYAKALYRARCQFERGKDAALSQWIKRLLVALPGKMGQRDWQWEHQPGRVPPAVWSMWWDCGLDRKIRRMRSLANQVAMEHTGEWAYDAVGAIACWVTSAARMHLLRGIRAVGWSENYYCDCDSMLLSERGWDKLQATPGMVGDGLGQWQLRRVATTCRIDGIKNYTLDGQRTCAGLPRYNAEPSQTVDHWWYRTRAKGALLSHHAPAAQRVLQKYQRVDRYTAGVVGPDGVITPHVREE